MKYVKLIAVAAMLLGGAARAETINVAVAANFTDATRDIVPLFEKASGNTVKVSFGSTGKLYAQIENGAPFDVFLAADIRRPQKAEQAGIGVKGTRFTYAQGRVVLWSPTSGLFGDGSVYLRQGKFARLAMANPKIAPYGLAARQVMEKLGIWSVLKDKLVRGESISQTFQFTVTGNAQAGFVAYSQVKGWKRANGSLWVIPAGDYTPIEQQAILLKNGEHSAAAKAFMAFLKGPQARKVIEAYGYGVK